MPWNALSVFLCFTRKVKLSFISPACWIVGRETWRLRKLWVYLIVVGSSLLSSAVISRITANLRGFDAKSNNRLANRITAVKSCSIISLDSQLLVLVSINMVAPEVVRNRKLKIQHRVRSRVIHTRRSHTSAFNLVKNTSIYAEIGLIMKHLTDET